jgi:hypothetical protein
VASLKEEITSVSVEIVFSQVGTDVLWSATISADKRLVFKWYLIQGDIQDRNLPMRFRNTTRYISRRIDMYIDRQKEIYTSRNVDKEK